jgi:hypothetical protein
MKTAIEVPTTSQKEQVFNDLVRWMEFYKEGGSLSYLSFNFRHVHDGIAISPKNGNHVGSLEMKVLGIFCENFGFGLSVFVRPGDNYPSVEINICKE